MERTGVLWTLAVLMTLSSAAYQRLTGPTRPVRGEIRIEGEAITYTLLRSHETGSDARMHFRVPDPGIRGEIEWKRQRSGDEWKVAPLTRDGDELIAIVPRQPPAGKVAYQITLIDGRRERFALTEEPVVIRFKGVVPFGILLPHIAFMFTAMLLGTRAGLEALAQGAKARRLAVWTAGLLSAGGMVLGPIVQKYAFDAFWTGLPLGHDLTDNKTAVALLFWLLALWRGRNLEKARPWIIVAAIVQLVVFLIPHSVLGSELDYTKME
jgi:hypothetical protein